MNVEKIVNDNQLIAICYLKTLGDYAHLFECNDKNKYVIKFHYLKKERRREIINEYVACKLGELLQLPIFPVTVVYVPEAKLLNIPKSSKAEYLPGYHLAFPYLDNGYTFPNTPPARDHMFNRHHLAKMIVFDQWINNTDRSRSNILFTKEKENKFMFHMIDHGRCFPGGYEWTTETLEQIPQYRLNMPVYKWALSLVYEEELYEAISTISGIKAEKITSIISSIPAVFDIQETEKNALINFLLKNRKYLESVVDQICNQYCSLMKG